MNIKDILLRKLDSILNPKLENRLILTFLALGAVFVGKPVFLAFQAEFSVTRGDTTVSTEISNNLDFGLIAIGLIFLSISIALYIFKVTREKREQKRAQKKREQIAIETILEAMLLPAIDEAIDQAELLVFYSPVLHYFHGIESLFNSSSFSVSNPKLNKGFEHFYHSFNDFCSHGLHFKKTYNPDYFRFIKPHEVGDIDDYEKYEAEFKADLRRFRESFKGFIQDIRHEYPDIDIASTNRKALLDYRSYYAEEG
ncbi:hypothetical protein P7M36_23660 [Vibrio parahaemolyticus]|uniref:hypothetical protein n=1 Tax=Vibrio TaxID=662 RepID=UPI000CE3A8CD|nr:MULTISPECIES: hypothetical protein [Vibrio]MCG8706715.1 hypothetical protein [Vibrio vulnificus]MDG2637750.1 hypothetical protein [Vibrio parahaemolyticus]HAS8156337.1 hypothetical protein [Vibrio vulnificus]HCH1219457.1 hypothetical protein [Vibrio parahaemolyticus]